MDLDVTPAFPRRRFTADEVLRMVEVGILDEDEPLELLDGELVTMSPQGIGHAWLKDWLHQQLADAYGRDSWVRNQSPLSTGPGSLPEPDLAVVRGSAEQWRRSAHHPLGTDALLVIEIAVSSQQRDRAKAALYAAAGVPVYWLVDIPGGRVHVYTDPKADGTYGQVATLGPEDEAKLPGTDVRLAVTDMMG